MESQKKKIDSQEELQKNTPNMHKGKNGNCLKITTVIGIKIKQVGEKKIFVVFSSAWEILFGGVEKYEQRRAGSI